jgi:hypothetical protein
MLFGVDWNKRRVEQQEQDRRDPLDENRSRSSCSSTLFLARSFGAYEAENLTDVYYSDLFTVLARIRQL